MYLLGYDIGSSTIKVALIDAQTQAVKCLLNYPEGEMDMLSRQRGWAEQQPEVWWQDFCIATRRMLDSSGVDATDIKGIGIAYQMHGLVLIDKDQQVLRPSIIWCDSRAVSIGDRAFKELGEAYCNQQLLNSPGNFTASKLKWVKDNEPRLYERIDKVLLPGDYIAMKLTGEAVSTVSGLTEGIFWNFQEQGISDKLLDYYGFERDLLAPTVPTFSIQGTLSQRAADRTGLAFGTPVTYRAGDQPNNALSLNVLHPGEIAATSGTSGVVYGIVDRPVYDSRSRVNAFAHVNYEEAFNRIGILLCLNGAGIQYRWIKQQVASSAHQYEDMERMAATVPVGSDGLCLLPFGNGAERMFENKDPNAHMFNLQFNRHTRAHMYRAALEGVAFSFVHGINILKEMQLEVDVMRVGNDNMFQSAVFSKTLATLLNCQIEVFDTTGAIGAAQAAGIAVDVYSNLEEALSTRQAEVVHDPVYNKGLCEQAYSFWQSALDKTLQSAPSKTGHLFGLSKQNERLKKEIKQKSSELAASALRQMHLKDKLSAFQQEVRQLISGDKRTIPVYELEQLIAKYEQYTEQDEEWEAFETHFNMLNDDFFVKIKKAFPNLSIADFKMCAFLKMGLTNKEMASRLKLSVRGIETRRYRLGKKRDISGTITVTEFLKAY